MSSSSKKVEIVIVGGGSGAALAFALSPSLDSSKHNLTVISPLPFAIHNPAAARLVVTSAGNLESKQTGAFTPYDRLFKPGKPGRFLQGRVAAVDDREKTVTLEGTGDKIAYDYLVLATGSVWSGPLSFTQMNSEDDVLAQVTQWREKIAKADRIVLVGGGAVGIEMAGEIKLAYPSKSVTVINAFNKLLNDAYTDKFRDRGRDTLEAAGVSVIVDDRLDGVPAEGLVTNNSSGISLRTQKGAELVADLFIPTFGPRPNTSFLKSFASGAALSPGGRVNVTPTLNVQLASSSVLPEVWAMGDIIEWDEQHMLMKATAHLAIVKKNLLATLAGSGGKLAEYQSGKEMIMVTVGKGGFGFLPFFGGWIVGNWFVGLIKSGSLFVSMGRKGLGY
ncbi:FAD/NAD(P)-binding domain-containing protein [Clavulina sp. PMI_390]|nr:FAD/NAD(P)-binding domain-containing protein [Clavulina sp. PMI_390]